MFSDLERRVIHYAEKMTKAVQVDGELVEELKRELSSEAPMQLRLSVAAANFTKRVNEAVRTERER